MDGTLHPLDAKFGIADGISRGLETVAKHFDENQSCDRVNELINNK